MNNRQSYKVIEPDNLSPAIGDLRGRLLLLDFDETLWLRNSTEVFLEQTRPAPMTRAILSGVRLSRPLWRRRAVADMRHLQDWHRVRSVIGMIPGALTRWDSVAGGLGRSYRNDRLVRLIADARPDKVIVISNGFDVVIDPLLRGIGIKVDGLVAAPLRDGGAWRIRGKVSNLAHTISPADMAAACFITDHESDADLLTHVRDGILCKWPEAEYRRAFSGRKAERRQAGGSPSVKRSRHTAKSRH